MLEESDNPGQKVVGVASETEQVVGEASVEH